MRYKALTPPLWFRVVFGCHVFARYSRTGYENTPYSGPARTGVSVPGVYPVFEVWGQIPKMASSSGGSQPGVRFIRLAFGMPDIWSCKSSASRYLKNTLSETLSVGGASSILLAAALAAATSAADSGYSRPSFSSSFRDISSPLLTGPCFMLSPHFLTFSADFVVQPRECVSICVAQVSFVFDV